ncbi:hypothetical protein DY000_02008316 [Brassica cretica]|uniref:DUF4005 domain-containing protein n=1 Tax=Brassica cretica TaxID=69181 RepID=A0ABQ7C0T9_BRACR|nr:hypothetical protein DY000_02008316 [Brassica cretica]
MRIHGLMSYRRFGRARSLRSDRASVRDRSSDRASVRDRSSDRASARVATELRLELGRYVATERNTRSVAA